MAKWVATEHKGGNMEQWPEALSKSESYFADGDGSKEPVTGGAHSRGKGLNPKAAAVDVSGGRQNKPKANNSFSVNCTELVEVRNLRSVWRIVAKGYKGAHFATFPLELVKKALSASISPGGCCRTCGIQFAPVVITDRQPTRPARNVKEWKADNADPLGQRSEGSPNRDPMRHITKQAILEYRPCCTCGADSTRPVVLDPFGGVMRTGRVAVNMGARFIGLEGSEEYARQGAEEIVRPYDPKEEPAKPKPKPARRDAKGQKLFKFR